MKYTSKLYWKPVWIKFCSRINNINMIKDIYKHSALKCVGWLLCLFNISLMVCHVSEARLSFCLREYVHGIELVAGRENMRRIALCARISVQPIVFKIKPAYSGEIYYLVLLHSFLHCIVPNFLSTFRWSEEIHVRLVTLKTFSFKFITSLRLALKHVSTSTWHETGVFEFHTGVSEWVQLALQFFPPDNLLQNLYMLYWEEWLAAIWAMTLQEKGQMQCNTHFHYLTFQTWWPWL